MTSLEEIVKNTYELIASLSLTHPRPMPHLGVDYTMVDDVLVAAYTCWFSKSNSTVKFYGMEVWATSEVSFLDAAQKLHAIVSSVVMREIQRLEASILKKPVPPSVACEEYEKRHTASVGGPVRYPKDKDPSDPIT